MNSSAPARRAARTTSSNVASTLGDHDVFADRAAEQEILLQHHAEAAAQMIDVVFAHVDAVDLDQAVVIGMQPLQQPRDGGLARAARPMIPKRRALGHLEGNILERRRRRALDI